jgi:hypothetical protein
MGDSHATQPRSAAIAPFEKGGGDREAGAGDLLLLLP